MGYLAFGTDIDSLIIYNMPPDDGLSIIARIFYLICITGSFVLLLQPIFHIIEHIDDKPVVTTPNTQALNSQANQRNPV